MSNPKTNMDGSIRAKVLQYKSDGNTLAEKWETLNKYSDGIYYTKEMDSYGYESYPLFFEENGVFWYSQITHHERSFNSPEHRQRTIEHRAKYREFIKEKASQNAFINTLQIEVMRRLGEDIRPLLASREAYLKRRDEEESKREKKRLQREQEQKEAEERRVAELLEEGKQKILEHKAITVEQIELLAEYVGYKIHIRTIGFLRDKVSEVAIMENENVRVWGRKLTSRNIDGTANVIREIASRLKEKLEKVAS